MKKRLLLFASAVMLFIFSCSEEKFDDTEVWNSIHSLEDRMKALETVMNAQKNNLYIQSVSEIENGYVITFSDGSKATILNGKDGDTHIQSITIGEDEVIFVLTDGQTFSIPRSSLYISFEEEDLLPVALNSTRDLHYTVKSTATDIEIEVIPSADLKAKVIANEESSLSGIIQVTTGATLDEYSKVIVLVSDGEKVIMKSIAFEEAGLQIADNSKKEVPAEGEQLELEFFTNTSCEAIIPESAQRWISLVPTTRSLEKQCLTFAITENTTLTRSTTIQIVSVDRQLTISYTITQKGVAEYVPDDEIWYVTTDGNIYDLTRNDGKQPFDKKVISNTYENGKGIIKLQNTVTSINNYTFSPKDYTHESQLNSKKLIELYLPNTIKILGDFALSGCSISTLKIPDKLEFIGMRALEECPNLENFAGKHVSIDGRCVIIDGILYGFAPKGLKEYTLPFEIEEIYQYVFMGDTELENIIFHEGLKRIGCNAFHGCTNLKSITIPQSMENIAPQPFADCPRIEGFYGNNKFHTLDNHCLITENSTYRYPNAIYPRVPDGTWLENFAGQDVTDYIIPEGIVGIEDQVFLGLENLRSITFPNSMKSVNIYAIRNCPNLENIYGYFTTSDHKAIAIDDYFYKLIVDKVKDYIIPKGIISIGYGAFNGKKNLETITMDDDITEIEGYAFSDCPNLKKITLSASLRKIGYNPFIYSDNLESVYFRSLIPPAYSDTQMSEFPKLKMYVPKQSLELYQNSPAWKDFKQYFVGYEYDDLEVEEPDYYISSDYSQDGKVIQLQQAAKGNGIDIILMGDGYSDRQIADGTYGEAMTFAYENLFTEEPYKTYRDLFNVYAVTAVSATEGYEHNNTVFGGNFGEGTLVGGSDKLTFQYAQKAISEDRMDDALIVVMMNSERYAGTCYMYSPSEANDYGSGVSVAYFPVGTDEADFAQSLHHEACGHGFCKLDDEYAYESMGAVTTGWITNRNQAYSNYGWWKNIDFTNDPSSIKWHRFLSDSRYEHDGLGAFEGGSTYWTGVWRPTENSIMRYNTGGFNAPSREAIYYRIHKLAYGADWEYDYEDFVTYDAINRKTAESLATYTPTPKIFRQPHPPVVVGRNWRDAK